MKHRISHFLMSFKLNGLTLDHNTILGNTLHTQKSTILMRQHTSMDNIS